MLFFYQTLYFMSSSYLLHSVHAKIEEKMTVIARRDGGLDNMDLKGHLTLRISDDAFGRIKLQIRAPTNSLVQTQTHPNVDKELMRRKSQIALKNPAKPFPLNTDVGVLKWRLQTTDESNIPLSSKFLFFWHLPYTSNCMCGLIFSKLLALGQWTRRLRCKYRVRVGTRSARTARRCDYYSHSVSWSFYSYS